MKVNLVRRWGPNPAGDTVTVDDVQGRWLLDHHFAVRGKNDTSHTAGAVAAGTDGPDVKAGGDATRRYPATRRGNRDGNLAAPVAGSPTSYTAGVETGPAPTANSDRDSGQGQVDTADLESGPSTKVSATGRRRKA